MMISLSTALTGVYAELGGYGEHHSEPVPPGTYRFPFTQVDDLANVDRIIKPLCDQTHQMFGEEGSPSFDAAGVWSRR